ncbi:MurE-like ligase [Rubripirellula obstinata]|uniref:MurE-like ligase n=1 Tax=Rubripirellula obstinata TaxID=406547 RepID=A0A5B1CNA1_9BACT|nr:Mur ligase family protein [Rubripirellula obstinata]KAA1261771.1 MurE-like ligase [Rubripirellula obstinata]
MRQKSTDTSAIEFSSAPTDATRTGITSTSEAPTQSLRGILAGARFHAGSDVEFVSVAESSKTAMPGDLVVYRIGQDDPMRIVADALSRGASGILTEQVLPCPLPQCIVGDIELAMADINSALLNNPDQKLLTIGVVGSAGKTTTSLLISTLFRAKNIRTAYQTDLGSSDGVVQTTQTEKMHSASSLVDWVGEAVDCDSQIAIIEMVDTDLRQGRYDCIGFDLLVVTGSTIASQDFGPSALSCALETLNPNGVVIAPADDNKAMQIIQEAGVRQVSYGVRGSADVTAKIIDQSCGMTTLLVTHDDSTAVMETPLCGGAMAANQAAAVTVGLLTDFELPEIASHLGSLRSVPGRGQTLSRYGHASVMIDVAGSAERCATAMRTARSMKASGRLWCIAAISNEEDPTSLARLGNLLERFADHAIVTSFPEQKKSFLAASHAVLDGVEKCAAMRMVTDQTKAIQWAMAHAKPSDTILVMTNQSATNAHQSRKEIEAIETLVEKVRDEQEIARPMPTLKVFG